MPWESIAAIIVSIFAASGALYATFAARRKTQAESDNVIVTSAEGLVTLVMRQMEYLDKEMKELRAELETYREKLDISTSSEAQLRNEVKWLKIRVFDLEAYIKQIGHDIPKPGDLNGTPAPV